MPSVKLDISTGRYFASMDGLKKVTMETAQATAELKNKALDAMKSQAAATKAAGGTVEELNAVTKKFSTTIAGISTKNWEMQTQALDRVIRKQRELLELQQAVRKSVPTLESGHGFSDRMAVSAVTREAMDGKTSIRAIESVATMIPGVAAGAQVLATVLGAAGIAGALAEVAEKGYEAFHNLEDGERKAKQAADELHDKSVMRVDDLELENQKIQDQIAKVSGHPNNGLATALLEAKKNADNLLVSLREDRKEMEALFKEQQRGYGEKALHTLFNIGDEGTEKQAKELLRGHDDLENKIRGDRDAYNDAMAGAKDDKGRQAATKAFNDAVKRDINARISVVQAEGKRLTDEQKKSEQDAADSAAAGTGYASTVIKNGTKIGNTVADVESLKNRLRVETLDESIYAGQKALGQAKQDKANSKDGKQADREAMEAQRRVWEQEDNARKIAGNDSAQTEADVWAKRLAALKSGSEQYVYAQNHLAEALTQARRKAAEEAKQDAALMQNIQRSLWDQDLTEWESAGKRSASSVAAYWQKKTQEADFGSANFLYAEKRALEAQKAAMAEQEAIDAARDRASMSATRDDFRSQYADLNLKRETGGMSRGAYAKAISKTHGDEYNAEQDDRDRTTLRDLVDLPEGQTSSTNLVRDGEAQYKADAERHVQIETDAANEVATTWQGALHNANAEWINDSQDTAKQVTDIYKSALDGLNDSITNLITGKKSSFSDFFRGLGKIAATDGLKQLEAGGLGSLSGIFGGGSSTSTASAGSAIGGGIAGIAQAAVNFGGGFALGGDADIGKTITVGEMGPEDLTVGKEGDHITPNKDLASRENPEPEMHFHFGQQIAREDIKATVRSMVGAQLPGFLSGAVAAVDDRSKRMTSRPR